MSGLDLKAHRARAGKAWADRGNYDNLLADAYRYAIPYRRPSGLRSRGSMSTAKGSNAVVEEIYDSTAVSSGMRFAGNLQNDMFPIGQQWFALGRGPIARRLDDLAKRMNMGLEDLDASLAEDAKAIAGIFQGGTWDLACHEMLLDVYAGTGCMIILEDEEAIADFASVPIDEVACDLGRMNKVRGIFWRTQWSAQTILDDYPKADISDELLKRMKDNPADMHDVCLDAVFMPAAKGRKRWKFLITLPEQEDTREPLFVSETYACPFILPRYYRVPGEAFGRGPVHLAMPTIKSLNKTMEMQFKSALLAIIGVWTATNDAQINPDTAVMEPGAIWKVGRNGGPLGPSLNRLDVPGRFDLSQMVQGDMRAQIKEITHDQALPPETGAVRSPTEIAARMKALAQTHIGAVARLHMEIVVGAVARVYEILNRRRLTVTNVRIDQLLVAAQITSPLAIASKASKIKILMDWLSMFASINPALVPAIADMAKIMVETGRDMGIDPNFIRSDAEQKAQEAHDRDVAERAVATFQEQLKQIAQMQRQAAQQDEQAQQQQAAQPESLVA